MQQENDLKKIDWLNEQHEIEALLKTFTTTEGMDFSVYQELFPILLAITKEEHPYESEQDRKVLARTNALKLTIVFGSTKEAVDYLARHKENRKFSSADNACIFSLPVGNSWNKEAWQRVIIKHRPNNPDNLILRVLPFLTQIEDYIKNAAATIKEGLLEQIKEEMIQKLTNDFAILKHDFEIYLKNNKKAIEKEIFSRVFKVLAEEHQGSLTKEQKKRISQTINNPNEAIKSKVEALKNQITQEVLSKAKAKFEKTNSFTGEQEYIEKNLNLALLHSTVENKYHDFLKLNFSPSELAFFARRVVYARAEENLEAAELFFKFKLQENEFNEFLSLIPNECGLIPNLVIAGEEIHSDYQDYYLKKLPSSDPRAALLGKFTGCCQRLDHEEGKKAAIYGITSPYSGFYVLCKKKNSFIQDSDLILSQCLVWTDNKGHLVFDSIESQLDFRKEPTLINDFYFYLAQQLISSYGFKRIIVGQAGTPQTIATISVEPIVPIGSINLYDSRNPKVLADSSWPIVEIYKSFNPHSKIQFDKFSVPLVSEEKMKEWYLIFALFDNDHHLKDLIIPYREPSTLSLTELEAFFKLTKEWVDFLQHCRFNTEEDNLAYLNKFLEAGIDLNLFKMQSFLIHALEKKQQRVVEFALKHRVNLNIKNIYGKYPLHITIAAKEPALTQLLLENGADIAALDIDLQTPLHTAVNYNDLDSLHNLLAHGASLDAKDRQGNTPFTYAYAAGNIEMIRLFSSLNAPLFIPGVIHLLLKQSGLKESHQRVAVLRDSYNHYHSRSQELTLLMEGEIKKIQLAERDTITKLSQLFETFGLPQFTEGELEAIFLHVASTNSPKIAKLLWDSLPNSQNFIPLDEAIQRQNWKLVEWFIEKDYVPVDEVLSKIKNYCRYQNEVITHFFNIKFIKDIQPLLNKINFDPHKLYELLTAPSSPYRYSYHEFYHLTCLYEDNFKQIIRHKDGLSILFRLFKSQNGFFELVTQPEYLDLLLFEQFNLLGECRDFFHYREEELYNKIRKQAGFILSLQEDPEKLTQFNRWFSNYTLKAEEVTNKEEATDSIPNVEEVVAQEVIFVPQQSPSVEETTFLEEKTTIEEETTLTANPTCSSNPYGLFHHQGATATTSRNCKVFCTIS